MREKHTSVQASKPSIEAFALPSELRRTHNFASRARPIIGLDLPSMPLPGAAVSSDPLTFPRVARRPAPQPVTDFAAAAHRHTDGDPPFLPPSLWREPTPPTPPRRRWNWSERSTAGFLGFAVGLLIVVPLVFMIGANPNAHTSLKAFSFDLPSPSAILEKVRLSAIFQVLAPGQFGTGTGETLLRAEPPQQRTPVQQRTMSLTVAPKAADLQATAARALTALAAGRVEEARSTLRAAASPEHPRLWLLLAETYDPNLRAADQPANASDNTAADVEFARFYYRQALSYGQESARARLAALPGQ